MRSFSQVSGGHAYFGGPRSTYYDFVSHFSSNRKIKMPVRITIKLMKMVRVLIFLMGNWLPKAYNWSLLWAPELCDFWISAVYRRVKYANSPVLMEQYFIVYTIRVGAHELEPAINHCIFPSQSERKIGDITYFLLLRCLQNYETWPWPSGPYNSHCWVDRLNREWFHQGSLEGELINEWFSIMIGIS